MRKVNWWREVWAVAPIGVVVGIGVFTDWLALGPEGVQWLNYIWLVAGWLIGWWLVEADKVLSRIKSIERFASEWDRSIRNIVTVMVLAGLGLWLASSSSSLLASAMVFGLSVRLFSELLYSPDYKNWYWMIARAISEREHRALMAIWGGLLLFTWLTLVRG